jgi:hypothetical protein
LFGSLHAVLRDGGHRSAVKVRNDISGMVRREIEDNSVRSKANCARAPSARGTTSASGVLKVVMARRVPNVLGPLD